MEVEKLKDSAELVFYIPKKKISIDDLISAVPACRDPRDNRCTCKKMIASLKGGRNDKTNYR